MVRITCTLSFSTDDEPVGRSRQGSFDDHYKRVVWSRDGEHGKYQEEGDVLDIYDGTKEEEVPDISLATFFDGCSLHGANHVFVEEKFSIRRGLWMVVFLLAVSMFLMQVVDRVIYYLQYDYITLLDERNARNMTFPAITALQLQLVPALAAELQRLAFHGAAARIRGQHGARNPFGAGARQARVSIQPRRVLQSHPSQHGRHAAGV